MKKFFFITSMLVFVLSSQGQDIKYLPSPTEGVQVVTHANYTLGYSEEYEQAVWVAYELTADELVAKYKRTDNFREDPLVKTGSASLNDYKGSGYDRGHLAPAADMAFSSTAMSESFYLSNMSPQSPSFNRGIWMQLEEQVRAWAQAKGSLYIVTGAIISDSDPEIGGNGVEIPSYYYKVLYDENGDQAIGFVLKNEKGSMPLLSYAVPVDEVEKLTMLDFFPQLEDILEDRIEASFTTASWSYSSYSAIYDYSNNSYTSTSSQQCQGIAKSTGVRCKNKTKNENGYCHHHQSQASNKNSTGNSSLTLCRCAATTQAGTQCKRKPSSGSSYCWQHQ